MNNYLQILHTVVYQNTNTKLILVIKFRCVAC